MSMGRQPSWVARSPRVDASLVRASLANASAFRQLYDRHAPRIYAFHLRRTSDPDAALDLMAETFAQAWRSLKRFDPVQSNGDAGPWLYGIARHVLLTSIRRNAIEKSAREQLGLLQELPAYEEASIEAWPAARDELLGELSDEQREAIELHVIDEISYADAATQLGCSEGAVRSRVSRGLQALRASRERGPR